MAEMAAEMQAMLQRFKVEVERAPSEQDAISKLLNALESDDADVDLDALGELFRQDD
jgi:hypothetical protein